MPITSNAGELRQTDVIETLEFYGYNQLKREEKQKFRCIIPVLLSLVNSSDTEPTAKQETLEQVCQEVMDKFRQGIPPDQITQNLKSIPQQSLSLDFYYRFWLQGLRKQLKTFSPSSSSKFEPLLTSLRLNGMVCLDGLRITKANKSFLGWLTSIWNSHAWPNTDMSEFLSTDYPDCSRVVAEWRKHINPYNVGMLPLPDDSDRYVCASLHFIESAKLLPRRLQLIELLGEAIAAVSADSSHAGATYGSFVIWLYYHHLRDSGVKNLPPAPTFNDIDLLVDSPSTATALERGFKDRVCHAYRDQGLSEKVNFIVNIQRLDPIQGRRWEYQTTIITIREGVTSQKEKGTWILAVDLSTNPEKIHNGELQTLLFHPPSSPRKQCQSWPVPSLSKMLEWAKLDEHSEADCKESQKLQQRTARAPERIAILEQLSQCSPLQELPNQSQVGGTASSEGSSLTQTLDDDLIEQLVALDGRRSPPKERDTTEANKPLSREDQKVDLSWLEGTSAVQKTRGKGKKKGGGSKGRKDQSPHKADTQLKRPAAKGETRHEGSTHKAKLHQPETLSEAEYQRQRKVLKTEARTLDDGASKLPSLELISASDSSESFKQLQSYYESLKDFSERYPDTFFNQQSSGGKAAAENIASHRFEFHSTVIENSRKLQALALHFITCLRHSHCLTFDEVLYLIRMGGVTIHTGALHHQHFHLGMKHCLRKMKNHQASLGLASHPSIYLPFIYFVIVSKYEEIPPDYQSLFINECHILWKSTLNTLDREWHSTKPEYEYLLRETPAIVQQLLGMACRLRFMTLCSLYSEALGACPHTLEVWVRGESKMMRDQLDDRGALIPIAEEAFFSALEAILMHWKTQQSSNNEDLTVIVEKNKPFIAALSNLKTHTKCSISKELDLLMRESEACLKSQEEKLEAEQKAHEERLANAVKEAQEIEDQLIKKQQEEYRLLAEEQQKLAESHRTFQEKKQEKEWVERQQKLAAEALDLKKREESREIERQKELSKRKPWDDLMDKARAARKDERFQQALAIYAETLAFVAALPIQAGSEGNPKPFIMIESASVKWMTVSKASMNLSVEVCNLERFQKEFTAACRHYTSTGAPKVSVLVSKNELYTALASYARLAQRVLPVLESVISEQYEAMTLLLEHQAYAMHYQDKDELAAHIGFLRTSQKSLEKNRLEITAGHRLSNSVLRLRQQWQQLMEQARRAEIAEAAQAAARFHVQTPWLDAPLMPRRRSPQKSVTSRQTVFASPSATTKATSGSKKSKTRKQRETSDLTEIRQVATETASRVIQLQASPVPVEPEPHLNLQEIFKTLNELQGSLTSVQIKMQAAESKYQSLMTSYRQHCSYP
ncbi:hypothetical protein ACWJJH_22115 [Endozoicomonadaceae bacterium StTr2]